MYFCDMKNGKNITLNKGIQSAGLYAKPFMNSPITVIYVHIENN
jgi:hypothetical protein